MTLDSLKYAPTCSCGKNHNIETVFCAIESGCLKNIDSYMKEHGLAGFRVAVYDENTYKATADRHPSADLEIVLNPENLHADEHGVQMLAEALPEECRVLIAVGSGTVHDIVRYCAYKNGADFVSCPTAASVDGFCSSVAAMTWNGCKKTLTAKAPKIVVADVDIIKNAPIRLTKSGFGDMVGKYVALSDWKIANILKGEFYCEKIANMMFEATEKVVNSVGEIIEENGNAYENLMAGLILSGLAMQMMGNSRPASGAEHHISHLIETNPEQLNVNSDGLHGEKVGVGTLLAIEEYKRLCSISASHFKDYTEYSDDFISAFFGRKLSAEITKENETDSALGIKGEDLKSNWDLICNEISKLPDIDFLKGLYSKYGIKSTLEDVNVPNDKKETLLDVCPCVRNRLTLMRLRKTLL